MAGRAATAVKSKVPPKTRSGAKASSRVKAVKKAPLDGEAPKPRRRVKVESRTRLYWAVFNQDLKRVAMFEFDKKAEAEKRAAKLMSASGEEHIIQKIKATVAVT
ncbi:hypothetical protein [Aureliella helgolandensis]|uniref:Uncharacterized protein n=1 Tax=Aureliella helgolandensis TaxID=2527968 RepID=A0A518GCA5_9BACT|nr:hypothetical protein [Aureliella helgolandensis]QDV26232.1 hypothetical protein Q31a_46040 [Aureliella helgolandensis]